jgi:hypothetical protein
LSFVLLLFHLYQFFNYVLADKRYYFIYLHEKVCFIARLHTVLLIVLCKKGGGVLIKMSEANLLRWPINIAKLLTNNKSSGDDKSFSDIFRWGTSSSMVISDKLAMDLTFKSMGIEKPSQNKYIEKCKKLNGKRQATDCG